jgi:hypothetical protein
MSKPMSVFRKIFGPSRAEIWRQFSGETGSNFIEGGFWKSDKVEATHDQWTITLDLFVVSTGKSSTTYTRIRAPMLTLTVFVSMSTAKAFSPTWENGLACRM